MLIVSVAGFDKWVHRSVDYVFILQIILKGSENCLHQVVSLGLDFEIIMADRQDFVESLKGFFDELEISIWVLTSDKVACSS